MTAERFATLTTAHLTDACVRAGVEVRCAPSAIQAVVPGMRMFGRALPARHVGSVDVFLEAIDSAAPGEILVADNGGRVDEACIGDLLALEAQAAGLGGIVIWGLHRDSVDLAAIDIPVFSLGSTSTGPLSVDERPADALERANVDLWSIGYDDFVAGDEDGVIFLPADRVDELLTIAEGIRDTERAQADRISAGTSLREQVRFGEFLQARESNPGLTFREHLRSVGGEIEV